MDPGLTTTGGPREEAIYIETGVVEGSKVTQEWMKRHVLSRSCKNVNTFTLLHQSAFSFEKSDDREASYCLRCSTRSGISPRLCT